ncbi:MAG: DUF3822 family protein, partial [Bacteroidota bacterium]
MAKILFDIAAAQDPGEWLQAHLVMEISPHIFSYTLLNPDKKILQLRFYEMESSDNPGLAEELATVLGSDEIIQAAIEKKTLIYNFPESQLVPEKYFEPEAGKDMVELLHGDLNSCITLSERIPG